MSDTRPMPADTFGNALAPLLAFHVPLALLAACAIWSQCPELRPAALTASPDLLGASLALGRAHAFCTQGDLAMLGAILLLELVVVGYAASSVRHLRHDRSTETWHELWYLGLQVTGWMRVLTVIFTGGALYAIVLGWGAAHGAARGAAFATGWLPADVALFYLIFTFIEYWWHRAQHSRRLWPLHRQHHAATRLSPLVVYRSHPAAEILGPIVSAVPLALPYLLVPIPLPVALVIATSVGLHNKLEHSMLPWTLGWVGRWLLVSPIGHRIHHSPLAEHVDRNFSTCPLWDRLFGTWYDGSVLNEVVGLAEPAPADPNLLRQWVQDLRELTRRT